MYYVYEMMWPGERADAAGAVMLSLLRFLSHDEHTRTTYYCGLLATIGKALWLQ